MSKKAKKKAKDEMPLINMANGMKPFAGIMEASQMTGLSQFYLRSGCRDGTVPHIKSGQKYLINIPKLLRQLDAM